MSPVWRMSLLNTNVTLTTSWKTLLMVGDAACGFVSHKGIYWPLKVMYT